MGEWVSFQFIAVLQGLGTNIFVGAVLLVLLSITMLASATTFWRTERKALLLVFALPIAVASLPGTTLLCEAIAH